MDHTGGRAVIGWRPHWARHSQDRIVSMIHAADLDGRLVADCTGVIASEFAERTLRPLLIDIDLAFQSDLRLGRHRQLVEFAQYHVIGLSSVTAGVVDFRN